MSEQKTIRELTAEIRDINIEKGWRDPEGGSGRYRFDDYLALLHSEVSEALETYRRWGLVDATERPLFADMKPKGAIKPEGVGSELADVVIRLLDMADVFGVELDMPDRAPASASLMGGLTLAEVPSSGSLIMREGFGSMVTVLHRLIADIPRDYPASLPGGMGLVLRVIVRVAEQCGIDLTAEVTRKIAFNRTRGFRHSGKKL